MKVWAITLDVSTLNSTAFEIYYTRGLQFVDEPAQTKIKRFFRREDAFRSLVGNLLPRVMLHERGVPVSSVKFAKTEANKPYICTPITDLPEHEHLHIGYNVTHDAGLIAMAFEVGTTPDQPWIDSPAHRIGVDVMHLSIPDRFTLQAFVETVGDALTPYEKQTLNPSPPVSSSEALYHFYLIWTLKEAYTKALGLGLGFDFQRIEYDKTKNRVKVDGIILKGWTFDIFRVPDPQGKEGDQGYIGVAAKCVGGKREAVVRRSPQSSDLFSLSIITAEEFMSRALREFE
ncbi:hypothetical protein BDM02DRAFT_3098972 [Thelephora ganbajun]|uniref:Uncharacterized protein n=1 Tax=Thelephora ganbajun TaxID=370292 RepID=A0ACB6ZBG1_THEGA|nr:hypothetical protein BDM02DRAFT_3098972 [Thelephora ganbajun]